MLRFLTTAGLAIACGSPNFAEKLTVDAEPSPEVCNGRDDDGDGFIDEDGPTLCEDDDPCTVGSCDGVNGCIQALPDDVCQIDGACVSAGASPSGEVCRVCDPIRNATDWSATGPDVTCNDGESCTTDDRCQGGVCRGDGVVPDPDPFEPTSESQVHDTLDVAFDDEDDFYFLDATLDQPDDVDRYRFRIVDESQLFDQCLYSTKQPQPHALVTGSGLEVCVTIACEDGPPLGLTCVAGQAVSADTCCGNGEVTAAHDCSATDDSADVTVEVVGPGDQCANYGLRYGNLNSGCGF